jgi:hypothetical protein
MRIRKTKIFVCYRRGDASHQAGRLFDHLIVHFGKGNVFKDVDSMPLGEDFRRILGEKVGECDVLLALVGDDWLSATVSGGARRIDDPADFVRIEIETALGREIPVIPLLVGQAPVPAPESLPPSLRGLAFRHGMPIRPDPDFHRDVERLITGISAMATPRASTKPHAPARPTLTQVVTPAASSTEIRRAFVSWRASMMALGTAAVLAIWAWDTVVCTLSILLSWFLIIPLAAYRWDRWRDARSPGTGRHRSLKMCANVAVSSGMLGLVFGFAMDVREVQGGHRFAHGYFANFLVDLAVGLIAGLVVCVVRRRRRLRVAKGSS